MRKLLTVIPLFLALAAVGCGPTIAPGESCDTEGASSCYTGNDAFVCVQGKWKDMPCLGPLGCEQSTGTCDVRAGAANVACPSPGSVGCDVQDPQAVLRCSPQRIWVKDTTLQCAEGTQCHVTSTGTTCE